MYVQLLEGMPLSDTSAQQTLNVEKKQSRQTSPKLRNLPSVGQTSEEFKTTWMMLSCTSSAVGLASGLNSSD